MTPEEFKMKMAAYAKMSEEGDKEDPHRDADELMCDLLISFGYDEGVKIFLDMPKWYA